MGGKQDRIIQALLKKIGQALIRESAPKEEEKTPKEEYLEVYSPSDGPKKEERYVGSTKKPKDQEVLLALEGIQKEREQIAEQKKGLEQEKAKIADQHYSLKKAQLETNGIGKP